MLDGSVVNEVRNSFSDFCIHTCKSQCCRRGKIPLENESQVVLVTGVKDFKKLKIISSGVNNDYLLDVSKKACPSLSKDNLCLLYGKVGRPQVCSDYPIFEHGEVLIFDVNCLAVKSGLLDSKIELLKEKGYRVLV